MGSGELTSIVPNAYCLLPTAYCLLPTAHCLSSESPRSHLLLFCAPQPPTLDKRPRITAMYACDSSRLFSRRIQGRAAADFRYNSVEGQG